MNQISKFSKTCLGLFATLALSLGPAVASTITLPVVLEGQAQNLVINYNNSRKISEDQFGNIRETSYTLNISSIVFDQGPILFDELGGSFNARALTVSYPQGNSYVGLTWDFSWNCHGGCIAKGKFALELDSPTADLFANGDQLPEDFLKSGRQGQGAILLNFFRSVPLEVPMPTATSLTTFTVAVPESGTWSLALGGLAMVGVVLARRKSLQ